MSEKVYWDSCAWLGLINAESEKVRPLEYFYESARRGQYEIWTSTLTYVEVFRLEAEVRPFERDALDKIRNVLEQAFIKLIPLDMEVGRKARGLRRSHTGLTAADAVHLASALVWSINPLHTWDASHLLPFNNNLSCKDGQRLEICIPAEPAGEGLFRAT